jgi:hypothetical protein
VDPPADFAPDELSALTEERQVVRLHLMRNTVHLVSVRDCLDWRASGRASDVRWPGWAGDDALVASLALAPAVAAAEGSGAGFRRPGTF